MVSSHPSFADFRLASDAEVVRALGIRLRAQRMAKSMTQEELAERAGVALGAVKKLEATGKVTVQTLVNVARALDLVDEFTELFSIRTLASIADMEREELSSRRRARRPAGQSASGGEAGEP